MSKASPAHFERFPSEYHMLRFFGKYLPLLDVNASTRMVPGVYVYDGQVKVSRHFTDFLSHMEALTDLGIDLKSSTQRLSNYIVFFDRPLKDADEFVTNSSKPLDTSSAITLEVAQETETPKVAQEGAVVEQTEAPEVVDTRVADILAKAAELNTGPANAAKAALEAFGAEHGASLNKGKKFEVMLDDLKAHLEA